MKSLLFLRIAKVVVAVSVVGTVSFVGVASAKPEVQNGAKCTTVGAKIKQGKDVVFVCTKYGTKTKVLKWKRTVVKATTTTTTTTAPKATVVTTTSTVPVSASASQIVIQDYEYKVATGIKSTDVLSVTNNDSVSHTVSIETTGINIGGGYSVVNSQGVAKSAVTFDVSVGGYAKKNLPSLDVGTYNFYCKIHTSMRGTIVIS